MQLSGHGADGGHNSYHGEGRKQEELRDAWNRPPVGDRLAHEQWPSVGVIPADEMPSAMPSVFFANPVGTADNLKLGVDYLVFPAFGHAQKVERFASIFNRRSWGSSLTFAASARKGRLGPSLARPPMHGHRKPAAGRAPWLFQVEPGHNRLFIEGGAGMEPTESPRLEP